MKSLFMSRWVSLVYFHSPFVTFRCHYNRSTFVLMLRCLYELTASSLSDWKLLEVWHHSQLKVVSVPCFILDLWLSPILLLVYDYFDVGEQQKAKGWSELIQLCLRKWIERLPDSFYASKIFKAVMLENGLGFARGNPCHRSKRLISDEPRSDVFLKLLSVNMSSNNVPPHFCHLLFCVRFRNTLTIYSELLLNNALKLTFADIVPFLEVVKDVVPNFLFRLS